VVGIICGNGCCNDDSSDGNNSGDAVMVNTGRNDGDDAVLSLFDVEGKRTVKVASVRVVMMVTTIQSAE
jgi:hypothetical protein